MSQHCCPQVTSSRYGARPFCACGWVGPLHTTVGGASVSWAQHVRNAEPLGVKTAPEAES